MLNSIPAVNEHVLLSLAIHPRHKQSASMDSIASGSLADSSLPALPLTPWAKRLTFNAAAKESPSAGGATSPSLMTPPTNQSAPSTPEKAAGRHTPAGPIDSAAVPSASLSARHPPQPSLIQLHGASGAPIYTSIINSTTNSQLGSRLKADAQAFTPPLKSILMVDPRQPPHSPIAQPPILEPNTDTVLVRRGSLSSTSSSTSASSNWKVVGGRPNSTAAPVFGGDASKSQETSGEANKGSNEEETEEELQLPVSLQADLGIDNVEEMVKVFKRASICDFSLKSSCVDWSASGAKSPPTTAAPLERRSSWLAQPIPFVSHKPPREIVVVPSSQSSAAATKSKPIGVRRHSVVDSMLLSGYPAPAPLSSSYESKKKGVPLSYFLPAADVEHRAVPIKKPTESMLAFSPPTHPHNSAHYAGHHSGSSHHHNSGQHGTSHQFHQGEFHLASHHGPLYTIEFKAGRTEVFYVHEEQGGKTQLAVKAGDFVIVEADRGEDLGRITGEVSVQRIRQLMGGSSGGIKPLLGTLDSSRCKAPGFVQTVVGEGIPFDTAAGLKESEIAGLLLSKEIIPKCIHRMATSNDLRMLQAKAQEEALAMVRCQSRIRQRKLPMDIVDAEYQWDRNKLTFYFAADRRIDFRELVRDLFRIYKTRIWMCAVDRARLEALGGMQALLNSQQPVDCPDDVFSGDDQADW